MIVPFVELQGLVGEPGGGGEELAAGRAPGLVRGAVENAIVLVDWTSVYFRRAIRVTLQQIAGGTVNQLRRLVPSKRPELVRTHRPFDPADYTEASDEDRWENFEAPQDVCATAYWYQTLPSPRWPPLEPYPERVRDLGLPR